MKGDLLVKNAKLRGKEKLQNILIKDGVFASICDADTDAADYGEVKTIDACGNLTTPPMVDSHVHLDAVLVADQMPRKNVTGTLIEGISLWSDWKKDITKDLIKKNAREVVDWYIANGVLRVRTHADCTEPRLQTVEALCELRDEVKDLIDIQVVAFPQDGFYTAPQNLDLMQKAVDIGVDVIGGAPHLEYTREDGVRDVEHVYDLAEKYGRLIDIHIDETGDPESKFVEIMVKESINRGMGSISTASHTTAMHNYNNDYAYKLIRNIKKAGMSMICNPVVNAVLQNRLDGYPRRRGITRVDQMLDMGINVCLAQDSIMDPWYAMGCAKMLQPTFMLLHLGQMIGTADMGKLMDMITVNPAKAMCLDNYGIEVGKQADLIVFDAKTEYDVIRVMSECTYVVRKGCVVAETTPAKRVLKYEGASDKPVTMIP